MKLIASTAPDENVNATSRVSRARTVSLTRILASR
jgi:hypothetical protein